MTLLPSVLIDFGWQASLFLGIGLVLSACLRKRPTRAHLILALAVALALSVPMITRAVQVLGWGFLAPLATSPMVRSSEPSEAVPIESDQVEQLALGEPSAGDQTTLTATPAQATSRTPPGSVAESSPAASVTESPGSRTDLPTWAIIWLALSAFACMRFGSAWIRGRRLVRDSTPVDREDLREALGRAAAHMGIDRPPHLSFSDRVPCPVFWPWGYRGVILIPSSFAQDGARTLDWEAVFTHELAHALRRDHLAQLAVGVLACLVPWHPLAWWTQQRLVRLADLSCDDWVLNSGRSASSYADSLLAFQPARRMAWAAAAVTNGRALRERVMRVLSGTLRAPSAGARWRVAAATTSVLLGLVVACAQPGSPDPLPRDEDALASSVSGVVVDASGLPVEGAEVRAALWDGWPVVRRTVTTDSRGGFRFENLVPEGRWAFSVEDPRYARQWLGENSRSLPDDEEDETLVLTVQEPRGLAGTVFNADGAPVANARVTLAREYLDDPTDPLQGHLDQDLAQTTTNASGRFRLDRLRPGWVTLMLDHPDYARTFTPGDPRLPTGLDNVELVLERGYTLRGRVMADGVPLAGVPIEARTINLSHRQLGSWDEVTDDEGRFELRGVSTKLSRSVHSPFSLVSVTVDHPDWVSATYKIFDEGKPELPFVEVEARPAGDSVEQQSIDINRPTMGTMARLAGKPSGSANISVTLHGPARVNGRQRQLWLWSASDVDGDGVSDVERQSDVDDAGHVLFDQLPAGRYSIWVPNLAPPSFPTTRVELDEGQILEVAIKPGPVRIHGTLTCGGEPVTAGVIDINALSTIPPGAFGQAYGAVNPDGTWEADGLSPGTYRITFDHGYGHSVPNYFVVEALETDTRFDIELPQTRIDFGIDGRAVKPIDYDDLVAEQNGMETWYDVKVYPGGDAPMGGNTAGIISVASGEAYVEHLPPGPWTLKTRDEDFRSFVAHVMVESDTAHVTATLARTDLGTATIHGAITGWHQPAGQSLGVTAYRKPAFGIDVTASHGALNVESDRYSLVRLPPGTYGLLLRPTHRYSREHVEDPAVPFVYVPDVTVVDGQVVQHDIHVPPARSVQFRFIRPDGSKKTATWKINLGGEDWLPFSIFVGSSPRANVAIPSPFPLAVGEHRLEVTYRSYDPEIHVIRVKSGTGVQEIDIVQGQHH